MSYAFSPQSWVMLGHPNHQAPNSITPYQLASPFVQPQTANQLQSHPVPSAYMMQQPFPQGPVYMVQQPLSQTPIYVPPPTFQPITPSVSSEPGPEQLLLKQLLLQQQQEEHLQEVFSHQLLQKAIEKLPEDQRDQLLQQILQPKQLVQNFLRSLGRKAAAT